MTRPYAGYGTRQTPQSEPIPGSTQVPNSAGGYAWAIDDWERLQRFLILGSDGGTYYVDEQKLTRDNAEAVARCIQEDGPRTVQTIIGISQEGRAARNDPAIFALAMCASLGDGDTRREATEAIPKVCRIGTHLFHFAEYAEQFRGWGRLLKRGVAQWYENMDDDELSRQVVKYRQRDGWSHRDLLRLSHPKAFTDARRNLYDFICDREVALYSTAHIAAFVEAQTATTVGAVVDLIKEHNLPREAIPTEMLTKREIWEVLLVEMPMTAMIRNLGNMSKVGLLAPGAEHVKTVTERLTDEDRLRNARIHPIQVLAALLTYSQGHGSRGSGEWKVVPQVVDALDAAFYKTFGNVEPTGKRLMLALDISGSMGWGTMRIPGLTPRTASAALALITAAVEPNYTAMGFSTDLIPLAISPRQRLDDVVRMISNLPFGGTDCSLPMQYALENKIEVDAFLVYTDNETWHGSIHPAQALRQYREKTGIPAKLVVLGMTATDVSIADPDDAGMLDVVGFDTAAPTVMSDFIR